MDFEETQNISLDLENQVAQRSQECTALEDENKSLKLEIADLVQSIERLMIEREEMESKIDSVKMENTKLVPSLYLFLINSRTLSCKRQMPSRSCFDFSSLADSLLGRHVLDQWSLFAQRVR